MIRTMLSAEFPRPWPFQLSSSRFQNLFCSPTRASAILSSCGTRSCARSGPRGFIEWLWTFDLVELSWEILRYRRFKMRLLDAYRATAIESLLLLLDGGGLPDEAAPMVRVHVRKARTDRRNDPKAAAEIEARLARSGFDQSDISTEAFMQARELFLMLDQLMHSAQNRRNSLLREIGVRPRFAKCACHLRLDQCR